MRGRENNKIVEEGEEKEKGEELVKHCT